MLIFLRIIHFFIILFFIPMRNISAGEQKDVEQIYNEKTFSGAIMGMGLSKSYQQGSKKICIYNTINGQNKLVYKNNNVVCPIEYPQKETKEKPN